MKSLSADTYAQNIKDVYLVLYRIWELCSDVFFFLVTLKFTALLLNAGKYAS